MIWISCGKSQISYTNLTGGGGGGGNLGSLI